MSGAEMLTALGFEETTKENAGFHGVIFYGDEIIWGKMNWGVIRFYPDTRTCTIGSGFEIETDEISIELAEAITQFLREIPNKVARKRRK